MSYDWSFVRLRPGEEIEEALERSADESDGPPGEHNQAIVDALLEAVPGLTTQKLPNGDWEITFTDESPIMIGLYDHQAAITLSSCGKKTSRIKKTLRKALACAHIVCREGGYLGWDAQEGQQLDENTQVDDVIAGYSHWLACLDELDAHLTKAKASRRAAEETPEDAEQPSGAAKPWWKFWS